VRRAALLLVLIGCADPEADLSIPSADPTVFRDRVYPVLLRDCGFQTCHGTPDRFFAVFGPGRGRLDPNMAPYDPATPYELAISYTRAQSMLFGPNGASSSLLLRKPIPVEQGGAGHKGDDPWGDPVYRSIEDARYRVIFNWAIASEGR
jgi:hypothetical protein